ncbi:hypothetical protein JHK82_042475 [Glycine max]|uniref:uncharacterized protein n=1 Tax=Glycine max TaxID=3847 RepID=UPI00023D2F1A|nr:uncharacterized protein LOC112999628 [Glycine max]KAG4949270.1 hypothetical protein JHK86_042509 [Glycine max]KAG4956762.1 hypothetical protein JHK85_043142 [Glycine max]KAG5105505.1 hypothetical protein JHK82_042475 [Glycine max]|eukprot:XP_025981744.1 uncharacterized protein LOC112999628 [Glycine max]
MNTLGDDMRYSGDSENKRGSQSTQVTGIKSPPTLAGDMSYADSSKDKKGPKSSGNGTQTHEDVSMRDKLSHTDDSRKKNGSKKSQRR